MIVDESYQKKRKQVEEIIQRLRLLDDDLMTKVFEDVACTELVLQIILQMPDLHVLIVQTQATMKNLQGRSIRLDVHAKDSSGKLYDIEVQRADAGAGWKRARYNSAVIDTNTLLSGEEHEQLPETYVIFITEHDVFGAGFPIYHIDRVVRETGKLFNDMAHIIYVNAQITNDSTELGRLMSDFWCSNPEDMYYQKLAERASYFKNREKEGYKVMCKAVEELMNQSKQEGREEGRAEGRDDGINLCIVNMLRKHNAEEVAEELGVPLSRVLNLIQGSEA